MAQRRFRGALSLLVLAVFAYHGWQAAFTAPNGKASVQRRDALGGAAGAIASVFGLNPAPADAYELPPLGYGYDALEPSIDKATMEFHHDKHHNTYITNINKALKEQPLSILDLQKGAIKAGGAVRNNGGGVYNHNFFWLEMAPTGTGGAPSDALSKAISEAFGSMDDFKAKFEAAGAPGARFGSGWVWLVVDGNEKLAITSTPNQDNPLMEGVEGTPGIPILGCDVWEHAYYLKYQYQRPAYLKAWWDVVNWNVVNGWYDDAMAGKAPSTDVTAAAAMVGKRNDAKNSPTGFKLNFQAQANFGN